MKNKLSITQKLPKDQVKIMQCALYTLESSLKSIPNKNQELMQLEFDILTLKALLNYDVTITMTMDELDRFTRENGVIFPEYV